MAVTKFPTLCNRQELHRFFGMVNYMGKLSAAIAENLGKLCKLFGKNSDWYWGPVPEKEFACLKSMMASTPTRVPYSFHRKKILSADSASFGLGAVLLQLVNGVWKPVTFASRSLSSAEQRYAQIEKEALASYWACEKFHYFLAGRQFTVETDHKPLFSILGEKELAKLPVRVQRLRLRMMSFIYDVVFTLGRKLVLADALSRAPYSGPQEAQGEPLVVQEQIDAKPVSSTRLRRIQATMWTESEGRILLKYLMKGWPKTKDVDPSTKQFYTFKDSVTTVQEAVFFENRLYIPKVERDRVLKDIRSDHQGETKCIRRAVDVVWWPGMTADIRSLVKGCSKCEELRLKPRKHLVCSSWPGRPW